jgi:hypothetical protein
MDNSSDENIFRIERSTNGTNFTQIAEVPANTTSYVDTGRSCNTPYWYRVRMYRASDALNSGYSNVLNLSTAICSTLNTPTNLSLSNATDSKLNLAWTDNAIDESEYRLERSTDAGATWNEIARPAANATSYSDGLLNCATQYQYRLRAYRAVGEQYSDYSSVLTASTSACVPPPAPILNYSATDIVTVTWSRISWATSYELQVSNSASFNTLLCSGTYHIDAPQRSQSLCQLSPGTYYWRVRALANTGGAWSRVETFVIGAP